MRDLLMLITDSHNKGFIMFISTCATAVFNSKVLSRCYKVRAILI